MVGRLCGPPAPTSPGTALALALAKNEAHALHVALHHWHLYVSSLL